MESDEYDIDVYKPVERESDIQSDEIANSDQAQAEDQEAEERQMQMNQTGMVEDAAEESVQIENEEDFLDLLED